MLIMKRYRVISKLIMAFMIFGIITSFCDRITLHAAFEQVVRVGYYESSNLQHGTEEQTPKNGYAYEYLRKLGSYTGWVYEYEYGTFDELSARLKEGSIDLILARESDAIINDSSIERSNSSIYSDSVNVYKKRGNSDILNGYISSLYSRSVGVLAGSVYYTKLMSFITNYCFYCYVVEYETTEELYEALMNEEIDLMVAPERGDFNYGELSPVLEVGEEDYYFCISNRQRLLMRELNKAMVALENELPFFKKELVNKYFLKRESVLEHTDEEVSWLTTHKSIRIGFLDNYMPYSSYLEKDGQTVTGLIKNLIDRIQEDVAEYRVSLKAVGYPDISALIGALQQDEIDAIFPIYQNEWYSELSGFRISEAVTQPMVVMMFSGRYDEETLHSIAVAGDNPLQYPLAVLNYSESELTAFDSLDACVDAIQKSDSMFTIMNRYKANDYVKTYGERTLSFVPISEDVFFCFAVKNTSSGLLSVLNHMIRGLDDAEMNIALQSYSYVEKKTNLKDLIEENSVTFTITALLIITLMLAGFALYFVSNLRRRREMEASQHALSTAKQQVENALQVAENASRAKSSFLFNMSHDIRTPMNAIIGFAELMERKKLSEQKNSEYVGNIKKAGKYLLELINEVLEMARIENGKIILDETVADLTGLAEDVRVIIEGRYREKNLQVTRDINIIHRRCYCDEVKLKAIIMNILGNAIKYTPNGGSIDINLHELEAVKEDCARVELCIRDSGIGMSREFVPHIFDSFSRERNATESKIVGTGLGMGIVKRYVDMMNGTIEIDSAPGEGTEVRIILDLRIAREDAIVRTQEKPTVENSFKGMRILLAEDNDMNREIAEELLGEYGFEVDTVADGVECVSRVVQMPADYYQLILMDVQMPNMNGWEATKAIREISDPIKSGIPVIALTANVFDSDRKRALETGMDGFIGKPIVISSLIEEIARVSSESIPTAE